MANNSSKAWVKWNVTYPNWIYDLLNLSDFNSINDFQTRSTKIEMDSPHGMFALKTLGLRRVFWKQLLWDFRWAFTAKCFICGCVVLFVCCACAMKFQLRAHSALFGVCCCKLARALMTSQTDNTPIHWLRLPEVPPQGNPIDRV